MAFSVRTQESFDRVLSYSLRTAANDLLVSGDLAEVAASEEALKKESLTRIMLTISGMDFRVVFVLHFQPSSKVMNLITQSNKEENSALLDDTLNAYFLEMGNRFCGEAKRLCHDDFDFLGMSTPYVLSKMTSMVDMHAHDLKCSAHVQYQLHSKTMMAGSLYVYSGVDLHLDLPESTFAAQDGVGELEFF